MLAEPNPQARPFRSVLYIPASNARAIEKARQLAADAIIFDLEDAVAPEDKVAARDSLAAVLAEGGFGARTRLVRVNALSTPWGEADVARLAGIGDALLIPKVAGPADLDAVAARAPGETLWAMMESPAGILNAAAIAADPRLAGMVMGTNDLAKDLGSRPRPDRLALVAALSHCVLAARAFGKVIVDGVFNAFRDEAGLDAECQQGRDLGFDGKSLIHPAQLDIANRVFAPSDGELALARRQIDAFALARAEGKGIAVLDGQIVENLHVAAAERLLARAEAIAASRG